MYRFVFLYPYSIADYLKFTMKSEVNLVFLTIIRKILCSQKQKNIKPITGQSKTPMGRICPAGVFLWFIILIMKGT